jgi:hypothetical protein
MLMTTFTLGSKKDLLSTITKNNSISHQPKDPLRYCLLPTIVKNSTISHKSSRDPLRYGWVHLRPATVSISHQSVETY